MTAEYAEDRRWVAGVEIGMSEWGGGTGSLWNWRGAHFRPYRAKRLVGDGLPRAALIPRWPWAILFRPFGACKRVVGAWFPVVPALFAAGLFRRRRVAAALGDFVLGPVEFRGWELEEPTACGRRKANAD